MAGETDGFKTHGRSSQQKVNKAPDDLHKTILKSRLRHRRSLIKRTNRLRGYIASAKSWLGKQLYTIADNVHNNKRYHARRLTQKLTNKIMKNGDQIYPNSRKSILQIVNFLWSGKVLSAMRRIRRCDGKWIKQETSYKKISSAIDKGLTLQRKKVKPKLGAKLQRKKAKTKLGSKYEKSSSAKNSVSPSRTNKGKTKETRHKSQYRDPISTEYTGSKSRGHTKKSYRTGKKLNKNSRKTLQEKNEEPSGGTNSNILDSENSDLKSRGDSNERHRTSRKMNKNSRKSLLEGNEEPRGNTKKRYRTGRKMNKKSRNSLLEGNEEPRGNTKKRYQTGRKMNKNSRKRLLEGNEEPRGNTKKKYQTGRKMNKKSRKSLLEGNEEPRGNTKKK